MRGGIQKKILSEISLFSGEISMPKGFEIDRSILAVETLKHTFRNLSNPTLDFPFSRAWDMLNTYIKDHIRIQYHLNLVNKSSWGNLYKPDETTPPLLQIDKVNLRNSPDYVLLYGVSSQECNVRIYYDDNRRKGRHWDVLLQDNKFIMFPATCLYYLTNKQHDILNFVQTITYEAA